MTNAAINFFEFTYKQEFNGLNKDTESSLDLLKKKEMCISRKSDARSFEHTNSRFYGTF
jgi:hypothetical protein